MHSDTHPALRTPLAAFATVLWPLFIAATLLLAYFWLSGFGAGRIEDPGFVKQVSNPDLRNALDVLSRGIDPIWITLAAVNVYIALARAEGLVQARQWSLAVLGTGLCVAIASGLFSLPLGPVFFPANLGPRLGPSPFAYPFLWLVIVIGARETILRCFQRLSHLGVAIGTGVLCAGTDWLLEPIAWKYRAWWLWYPRDPAAPPHAPWPSYATWLLAGIALSFLMRQQSVVSKGARPKTPVIIFACLVLLLVATRAIH